MGSFSAFHWLIFLLVVLVLFGASRLPKIGEGLGKGIKIFKKELDDITKEGKDKNKKSKTKSTKKVTAEKNIPKSKAVNKTRKNK